jgi:hypothetical protein
MRNSRDKNKKKISLVVRILISFGSVQAIFLALTCGPFWRKISQLLIFTLTLHDNKFPGFWQWTPSGSWKKLKLPITPPEDLTNPLFFIEKVVIVASPPVSGKNISKLKKKRNGSWIYARQKKNF